MSTPRPLTDLGKSSVALRLLPELTSRAETASLLLHNEEEEGAEEEPTFFTKLADIADQPLTTLSKILLAVCLFLLLLTSIFIGLFAGAEHKLNSVPKDPKTTVSSVTQSYTLTNTFTETSVSTTTDIVTTTTTAAVPIPTADPRKVCIPGSTCVSINT
jgi:endothelin-converting enzyme